MAELIQQDIFEREIIIDDLKRILEFIDSDEQQFRSRSKELTLQQRKFFKLQAKIEKFLIKSNTFDKDEQLKIRNNFNDCYFAISVHLDKLKEEDNERKRRMSSSTSFNNNSVVHVPSTHTSNSCASRLPILPMPTFSGETTDWPPFHDLFRSLVHDKNTYTETEKFRYLLLSLKDEPYNLIKSIPITDENYSVAWDILVSRYDNKRAIATKHLEKILYIEPSTEKMTQSLRNLLNVYQENIKALQAMQFPIDQWSFIIVTILLRKIPSSVRKRFELSLSRPSDVPDISTLITFLERELAASEFSSHPQNKNNLEKVGTPRTSRGNEGSRRALAANVASSSSNTTDLQSTKQNNLKNNCLCCDAQHTLTKCSKFLNLSPRDRYSFIQNKNVCFNCLHVGHDLKQCKSNFVCRSCHKRHHSLIHFEKSNSLSVISGSSDNAVSLSVNETTETAVPSTSHAAMTAAVNDRKNDSRSIAPSVSASTVLLCTALINVHVGPQKHTVRCIIDTGSQATFITESCVQRLGLHRSQANVPVFGVGGTEVGAVYPKGVVSCHITPTHGDQPSISVNALILSNLISRMPCVTLPFKGWPHIQNLTLADPKFYLPQSVEMLLGADILSQVLLGHVITGPPGSPMAMNSIFGYLLMGDVSYNQNTSTSLQVCLSSLSSSYDDDINLRRFWELESLPEKRILSPDEALCESIFVNSHTRDETGRYVVPLPFKPDAPTLGASRDTAVSRFKKLEYRLEHNPQLKVDYHACLQEYLELGHMEPVDLPVSLANSYYIPHHCVVKESSETTRTRVVFDAGCKTSNGISLNDVLLTGPKLHQDIVDVLLGFRIHAIAVTADIKQMYRNIKLQQSDWDFQRIVWRKSPTEPLRDYRLRTVTFGVSSSPYLALRTIQQLAHDEAANFSLGSKVLQNQVFVDDIVTGAGDVKQALVLQRELVGICSSAGFELRKWQSNSPALLAALQTSVVQGERSDNVSFALMENDKQIKVLGLQWNPESDTFIFSVQSTNDKITKRSILSQIAKIYDPMGWLSPVTIYAKHLIQLLWISAVDWDESPPLDIINAWSSFLNELPLLSNFQIPRFVFANVNAIQIHGFSDASERAYAACVYARISDNNDNVKTFLLLAKTRVAPIKPVLTIPRLELCAAVLLSKLIDKVRSVYDNHLNCEHVCAWTDSSIVLAWLRSPPHEWKTFVSNRTSEILSRLPAKTWRHVPSADNPADAPSRGMLPTSFVQNEMWLHGPWWLARDSSSWPSPKKILEVTEDKRNLPMSMVSNSSTSALPDVVEYITRFSTLGKLVRITALLFRFYNKCKKVQNSYPKYITVSEFNFCLNRLIHLVQHSCFSEDINNISHGKYPSIKLRRLNPFMDNKNNLRVGGRIHKSLLPFVSKHQLILPKKHHLTDLIIDHTHITHLHAGPQSVQYILFQKYWIMSSRDAIRTRIHRCVRCFRARPVNPQPCMGPLPAVRVRPERPFLKTSVDFAGPFYVRANKVRNAKIIKCYVSVFVCMSVKAIHLELVSELSTDAFLATLRRFTSRRGLCTDIYSDCGRNFVGCNNYLQDLYNFLRNDSVQATLNSKILEQGITWHFQPPYASHFGGLFESGVKSFKHHLHRVLGTQTQTYDEMHTLLCQIEAVLNSRPLCVLSADPLDPLPLTPAHFLIGGPLTSLPDISLTDNISNRLTRWRRIQQCVQHFWKRWSREYLHEIQQRNKWFRDRGSQLREGIIVIVRDDNLPPLQWRLARVHTLHPGSDNITRVVTLQMGKTFVKRSVVKICPLPLE